VTIFHHLNARNGATLYLCQNPLEVASVRALPFLLEQSAGRFLGIGWDVAGFINRSAAQKFVAIGRGMLFQCVVGRVSLQESCFGLGKGHTQGARYPALSCLPLDHGGADSLPCAFLHHLLP
jgi:hypothetical protein